MALGSIVLAMQWKIFVFVWNGGYRPGSAQPSPAQARRTVQLYKERIRTYQWNRVFVRFFFIFFRLHFFFFFFSFLWMCYLRVFYLLARSGFLLWPKTKEMKKWSLAVWKRLNEEGLPIFNILHFALFQRCSVPSRTNRYAMLASYVRLCIHGYMVLLLL